MLTDGQLIEYQLKDISEEMQLLRKNLQKIMEEGIAIKEQMNGTKKIEFPEPEYYV